MGFPATTGASFLPYLITDKIVAPESCRHCYSEHLAYMPDCYFVNDYKASHMVTPHFFPDVREYIKLFRLLVNLAGELRLLH